MKILLFVSVFVLSSISFAVNWQLTRYEAGFVKYRNFHYDSKAESFELTRKDSSLTVVLYRHGRILCRGPLKQAVLTQDFTEILNAARVCDHKIPDFRELARYLTR